MPATDAQRAAAKARRAIAAAGGLANQAELARHWGVTRGRVRELAELDDFPEPVDTIGESDVWAIGELDEWRANRPGPGRPPKHARA